MPTLMASAPASIMASAAARVARLPPMTCTRSPNSFFTRDTISSTPVLCAWAVSTTRASTPASASAWARFQESSPVPMPAPTSRRPEPSLEELGYWSCLTKSLTVIRPVSLPSPSTIGSFSTLWVRSRFRAASPETPCSATTSGMGVMTSRTGRFGSVSKRMSRLVQMPTSLPSSSTTGRPEMRKRAHLASTSPMVSSGVQVTGLETMPASERLTISTCCAWSSTDRLRCRMPMPPWRAMAMAMRDSVTVSMAAEMMGTLSRSSRVSWVDVSTADGITSEASGMSRTSSKVRPMRGIFPVSSPPRLIPVGFVMDSRPPGRAAESSDYRTG